ncbi:LysM peptidoglycan-binding domain-containing protein [Anaerolineales bacterium HSG6]|nr:LysM peptidoglycan-binding domain-containing protein [Anaerolineales bacterium HSG6]MDM8532562.1 LysM peptidoglycan-binding domain-containing protein [Anaerolineales bacterium HSG25]
MALAETLDKHHLTNSDGSPFFIMGVNYHGYFDRVWQMWQTSLFDLELIARDFRKAKNSGFNTLRLFVDATLNEEIQQDKFDKLDQTLDLAQEQGLRILLTLNDSHDLDLVQVNQISAKIVSRYKNHEAILGYDLENQPAFYHLAAAQYPTDKTVPLQTSQLIDHYGTRVSADEVVELKRRRHIPSHLNDELALYYINALYLFREYSTAIRDFTAQGQGTVFDFIISAEAAQWHPLIGCLEETIDLWLQTRMEPIRATGSEQPLTVSWNQLEFALLPCNYSLDFQSYQQYSSPSLVEFQSMLTQLGSLHRAFPDHPILLSEFGWQNQSTNKEALNPELTALYEGALYSYLRANNFAGGCKWALNDAQSDTEQHESQAGVFKIGDTAKPISNLVQRFAEKWPHVTEQALFFNVWRDLESGLTYRFDLPQQVTVGGHLYQDNAISWQAKNLVGHCFIKRDLEKIFIEAQGAGQLSIDPWNIVPIWQKNRHAELYRVYSDTSRTRQAIFLPGEPVVVDVCSGATYMVVMGVEEAENRLNKPSLSQPKPGEHVLLLGQADENFSAAVNYIQRFAPDISFNHVDIAGRWAYVTVVASIDEITDEQLEDIRAVGTIVVERISDSPQQILDDLARRGQRFLNGTGASDDTPQLDQKSYTVQPGDSLITIAQQIYGNQQHGSLLFEANQDKLTPANPLRVGTVLRIPELS